MYDLPLTFLRDTDIPASVLLVIVLRKYGPGCFDMDPSLLRQDIEDDFKIQLTDLQQDKLQAAITVVSTDQFESHWEVFETCCHLFNNQPDDFESFDPLEAEDVALALAEVDIIKNTAHEPVEYDSEVNVYAGLVFHEYGMSKPPNIFPTALMPESNECDDSEKNEALDELYKARLKFLHDLMNRLKAMHTT